MELKHIQTIDVTLQIVERTDQAELHAAALGLVLRSVEADPAVTLNFFRDGIALTLVVLQHPKCILSLTMLKTCLAQCGDLSEHKLWRSEILVDLVLPLWSRWDNECRKELSLFLTRCVRMRNRHHIANVHQLVKVNAIDRLLCVLKDECVSDQRDKFTSTVSGELLSFLDAALSIAQYPHSLLSSLVDFVILLHDAKLTYVVHSKTTRTAWILDLELEVSTKHH